MPPGPTERGRTEPALGFVEDELARLRSNNLLREPRLVSDSEVVLCSNDYLGLAKRRLDADAVGAGAGASPLVVGFHMAHANAEACLAEWLLAEAALLFTSGYAANLGTIGALVGPGDVVVSDALNHASIIDGCRQSGARVLVVPHLDTAAFASALASSRDARRRLVVTESYFSMDADGPDLVALRGLCSAEGAILMVDEAHSLGVDGPVGRGRCAEAGITPDLLVGTLGKSFGLQGAFVAGTAALRLFLWNRARTLVFSTGLSPALAAAVPERLGFLVQAEEARASIARLAAWVRSELREQGWAALGSGHVVPIVLGSPQRAVDLSMGLRREGLLVQAIRPPTVPEGSSRLRLTVTADTPQIVLERLLESLAKLRG